MTAVPEVTCPSDPTIACVSHNWPNHATPTSLPVEQFVKRCHSPAPSAAPLFPLQSEKMDSRSLRSTPGPPPSSQPTFHLLFGSTAEVVVGHAPDWTLTSTIPRLMLKVDWYKDEAVLKSVRSWVRARSAEP